MNFPELGPSLFSGDLICTLPETNIIENGWLEDEISFQDSLFSGAMLVSGSVYIYTWKIYTEWVDDS